MFEVIESSPVVKVIVPVNEAPNAIISSPAAALASAIALRRLPAPASSRFVTVKVAAVSKSGFACLSAKSFNRLFSPETRVAALLCKLLSF